MLEILNAAIAFPTVIFTGLLICMLLFWGSVIFAGMDPQALDPSHADAGDVDVGDAHVDVGDAHVDVGDAHVDVGDAHVDVGDAHVDAGDAHVDAGDAHVDAGDAHVGDADLGDVDADVDSDHDGEVGGRGILGAILGLMNVGTVPVSIVATAVIFIAWCLCMLLTLYAKPTLSTYLPAIAVGPVLLVGALAGGCLVGSLCTRPLRQVFKIETKHGGRALLEKFCTITTDHVNERFGEAELRVPHGMPLLLSVRCPHENKLRKGRLAVIVGYSKKKRTYQVAELPEQSEKIVRATLNPNTDPDGDSEMNPETAKAREADTENES